MATNLQTIERALRLLGVVDSEEELTGPRADDGLKALNEMLTRWEANNLTLGFSTQTSTAATLPVPDEALSAVAYNLAVELAPEYQVMPSQVVAGRAEATYRALLNDAFTVTPNDMSHAPGGRSRWNINTDS